MGKDCETQLSRLVKETVGGVTVMDVGKRTGNVTGIRTGKGYWRNATRYGGGKRMGKVTGTEVESGTGEVTEFDKVE